MFALFLGFRINASYDRFWEACKLWGSVLVDAHKPTRQLLTAIAPARDGRPFVLGLVGLASTMRNQLRGQSATLYTQGLLVPDLRARMDHARSAPTLLLWLGNGCASAVRISCWSPSAHTRWRARSTGWPLRWAVVNASPKRLCHLPTRSHSTAAFS